MDFCAVSETLHINEGSKNEKYESLLQQIPALIGEENDALAITSNLIAALKQTFDFLWVGIYRVKNDELILGPFQGPIACTRIKKGKGVCGKAWENQTSIIVPNVHEFDGHIACSSRSNSEIVIPIFNFGQVMGVLDIDSTEFSAFDEVDAFYLKTIVEWFVPLD